MFAPLVALEVFDRAHGELRFSSTCSRSGCARLWFRTLRGGASGEASDLECDRRVPGWVPTPIEGTNTELRPLRTFNGYGLFAIMTTERIEIEILELFEETPFGSTPPKYVRALRFRYAFTDPATRAETGHWWRRQAVGAYFAPVSAPGSEPASRSGSRTGR